MVYIYIYMYIYYIYTYIQNLYMHCLTGWGQFTQSQGVNSLTLGKRVYFY